MTIIKVPSLHCNTYQTKKYFVEPCAKDGSVEEAEKLQHKDIDSSMQRIDWSAKKPYRGEY